MFTQKVALVTGGSKGIGKACCYELRERGYSIALHYRSSDEDALKLASELSDCKLYKSDLSDPVASEELIKTIKNDYGRLDVLVNNAGAVLNKLVALSKIEDFRQLLSVNLESAFMLSKGASRLMMRQKSGSIINVSSVVAFTGNKGGSLYSATKGALVSFSKSLAIELGGVGIRVNCVAPGYIETNMTEELPDVTKENLLSQIPLGRFGKPEEVAKLVGFLASEEASYLTGSTFHVNGGLFRG